MLLLRKCRIQYNNSSKLQPLQIKGKDMIISNLLTDVPKSSPGYMYALVASRQSKLMCIDIDNHSSNVDIDDVLNHLQENLNDSLQYELLQDVIYVEKTKSSGLHLIFFVNEELLGILEQEEVTKRYKINIETELNQNDISIDMIYQCDSSNESLVFSYPFSTTRKSYIPVSKTVEIKEIDKSLFSSIMRYLRQFSSKDKPQKQSIQSVQSLSEQPKLASNEQSSPTSNLTSSNQTKTYPLLKSSFKINASNCFDVEFLLSSFSAFILENSINTFCDIIQESNYSYWMKVLFICVDNNLKDTFISFSRSVPYSSDSSLAFNLVEVNEKYNNETRAQHQTSISTLTYWFYLLFEQEICNKIIADADRQFKEIKKLNPEATPIKKSVLICNNIELQLNTKIDDQAEAQEREEVKKEEVVKEEIKEEKEEEDVKTRKQKEKWADLILEFIAERNNTYFISAFNYYYKTTILSETLYNKYNAVHLAIIFVLSTFHDKIDFYVNDAFNVHMRMYSFVFAGSNTGKNSIARSFDLTHKLTDASYASVQQMHYIHAHPCKRNFFQVVDEGLHDNISLIYCKDIKDEFKVQTKKSLLRLADSNNQLVIYSSKSSGNHPPFKLYYSFVAFSAYTDYPDEIDLSGGGFTRVNTIHLLENKSKIDIKNLTRFEIYSKKRTALIAYDKDASDAIKKNLKDKYNQITNDYNFRQTGELKSAGEIYFENFELSKKAVEATQDKDDKRKKDFVQIEKEKIENWCLFEHKSVVVYNCNVASVLHRLHLNNVEYKQSAEQINEDGFTVLSQRDDFITNKIIMSLFLDNNTFKNIENKGRNTYLDFKFDEQALTDLYIATLDIIRLERNIFTKKAKEYRDQKMKAKANDSLLLKQAQANEELGLRDLFLYHFGKKVNRSFYLSNCYAYAKKLRKYVSSVAYEKEIKNILVDLENQKRLVLEKDKTGKIIKFMFVN